MDPIPDQHQDQEEDIENITDTELERIEGKNIQLGSENVKFHSLGLAAQLFQVSLRTFREDYIRGKLKNGFIYCHLKPATAKLPGCRHFNV